MKVNQWGEPLVSCKHCGEDTSMTGTRMCDRCWELEHRISNDLELAKKIVKQIEAENGK